jgi:NAD(P)-dependent dehydrogenase (short-subunit alcohol dehydrogenase family)
LSRGAEGKRVLVTGASGTFGRAISQRLADLGASVVGLDLEPASAPAEVLACDLADDAAVPAAVEEALGRLGAWRVTAACAPALVSSRGRVVMVASRMAVLQLPLAAAYGASKRAMVAYADALRLELGTHVGVTCVYPSAVRSPIHDSTAAAGLSLEGMSQYEPLDGVVEKVLGAALGRKARRDVATTRRGAAELFLARHFPSLSDRIIARTMAKRIESGAFDGADLAAGLVARHAEHSGAGAGAGDAERR